jgi:hypothetical protein
MSLYFEKAGAGPRLHAFVIGVGRYPHLELGAKKPSNLFYGLSALTCTVEAAKAIANWLHTDYTNPDCPLGSVEMLLSAPESVTRSDGVVVPVEEATMANIESAFKKWYQRCDQDEDNIAFFYFAGHGVSRLEHFLLAGDFGDPAPLNDWLNCINFTQFKSGMRRCRAQTQLYFVDACRDTPTQAKSQLNPNGNPLVTASEDDDVRLSIAYRAAAEGQQAFGPAAGPTFFCEALLTCLQGAGARFVAQKWRVDTACLSSALSTVLEVIGDCNDLNLTCDLETKTPSALHYPKAGAVVLRVACVPKPLGAEAEIKVTQVGVPVVTSPVGEKRPWMSKIKTGQTRIDVTFTTRPPAFQDETAVPPTCEVEVR